MTRRVTRQGFFDGLEIASDARFRDYLNRFDVIYLDMTGVIGETSIEDMIPYIQRNVTRELMEQYPKWKAAEGFVATLANAAAAAGNKFIMIIDEWDAPIREAKNRPDNETVVRWIFFQRPGGCL